MVAMQAQVFPMAKWAIGLRLSNCNDKQVEDAFNAGKILRTHVLRPTWHFVSPKNIRWLLKLTGPRVRAFNNTYYNRHELDNKIFMKSNDILIKSLRDNKQLTRTALQAELKKGKVKVEGIRLAFIMMQAELDGVICSGAKLGNQFTYTLLEERVPAVKEMTQQESLSALAEQYFKSRGPATVADFSWWSGLSMKECRGAAGMLNDKFQKEKIKGQEYIYSDVSLGKTRLVDRTFYMPDYDEYGIAYKDRWAILGEEISAKSLASLGYPHVIVVDGVISGTWKVAQPERKVQILQTYLPMDLSKVKTNALEKAARHFRDFNMPNT
jgi:hypothetical protein